MVKSKIKTMLTTLVLMMMFQSSVYAHNGIVHADDNQAKAHDQADGMTSAPMYIGELLSGKLITKSELLSVISALRADSVIYDKNKTLLAQYETTIKGLEGNYIDRDTPLFRTLLFEFGSYSIDIGNPNIVIGNKTLVDLIGRALKHQAKVIEVHYKDTIERLYEASYDDMFVKSQEIELKHEKLIAEKKKIGNKLLSAKQISTIAPNCDLALFYINFKKEYLLHEIERVESTLRRMGDLNTAHFPNLRYQENQYSLSNDDYASIEALKSTTEWEEQNYSVLSAIRNKLIKQSALSDKVLKAIEDVASLYLKNGRKTEGIDTLLTIARIDPTKAGIDTLASLLKQYKINDHFILINGELVSNRDYIAAKDGKRMVPLRDSAPYLGYPISLNGATGEVNVGNGKALIQLDNINKEKGLFSHNNMIYISIDKLSSWGQLSHSEYDSDSVLSVIFE